MTHTPGPWEVKRESGLRQRIQACSDKGTLAYMTARPGAHLGNFSHDQIAANARLIAAAPDLLAALKELLAWHKEEYQSNPVIDARARDAIAKAEKPTETQ